jgi:hypothetical protein
MIEIIKDLPDHVMGFTAKSKVTGADYETVIIPQVEKKLEKYKKLDLLYHLGDEFSGFEAEAMWDDAKVGLMHLTSWRKIAIVSDVGWLRASAKVFGFVMPAHVKVFCNSELDKAKEWVSSE